MDIIIAEEVSPKISAVGTHNKRGQTGIYKQRDEDWNPEPDDDTTAFLSSFDGLLKLTLVTKPLIIHLYPNFILDVE